MNRRDFVKALAGVPLLGLLAKLPDIETDPMVPPAMLQKALAGIRDAAEVVVPHLQEMADSLQEAKNTLAKLPKAESDEWRETLVETTECAYMTNGESVKFDPPVNAGTFIDLYGETACYSFVEPHFIVPGDSEYIDVTVGHGSRLPLFEDNQGISAQAVRARIAELEDAESYKVYGGRVVDAATGLDFRPYYYKRRHNPDGSWHRWTGEEWVPA